MNAEIAQRNKEIYIDSEKETKGPRGRKKNQNLRRINGSNSGE
jgi:hypothetical protein